MGGFGDVKITNSHKMYTEVKNRGDRAPHSLNIYL